MKLITTTTLGLMLFMVVSIQAQYTQKWQTTVTSYYILSTGNTDADPNYEILVGYDIQTSSGIDSLFLIDGVTGTVEWSIGLIGIRFGGGGSSPGTDYGPKLVDVDDDNVLEIVFLRYNFQDLQYTLYCYDSEMSVGVNDESELLPGEFGLEQNYPNPFNPSTTIEYSVPRKSHVTISIFNVLGQKLATIVDEDKPAGDYTVNWDGKNEEGSKVASGVYLYSLQTDESMDSRKMLLLK